MLYLIRCTQYSFLSPLCAVCVCHMLLLWPDPIDLTLEDNALQKALALSLQEMQQNPSGAQISLEDQELSRWKTHSHTQHTQLDVCAVAYSNDILLLLFSFPVSIVSPLYGICTCVLLSTSLL